MIRKALHILVLTLFAVNMITVAAWAKPCAHERAVSQAQEEAVPCHGEEAPAPAEKQDSKHCAGLCLCDHGQFNPPVVINEADIGFAFSEPGAVWMPDTALLQGITTAPPQRPPKSIS